MIIEQGSDDWHALRCGKATASRISDIVRQTRSGVSASRARYLAELVCERLTGVPQGFAVTADMQRGKDLEPHAADLYAFKFDRVLERVAFVDHPTIPWAGASPDYVVGDDGLVEIKCPATHTHIETLTVGKLDADYIKQMQWQMACTGRNWCDFVSYDPRLPSHLQFYCKRIPRDAGMISDLEAHVRQFLDDVAETVERLSRLTAESKFASAS